MRIVSFEMVEVVFCKSDSFLSLRPWPVARTGPGPQSVPGRTEPSQSTGSEREPSTWSESSLATLLEKEPLDSLSP